VTRIDQICRNACIKNDTYALYIHYISWYMCYFYSRIYSYISTVRILYSSLYALFFFLGLFIKSLHIHAHIRRNHDAYYVKIERNRLFRYTWNGHCPVTRARISSQNSATSRHIIAIGMSTDNKRNPLHRMESSSIDSGRVSEAWIMHFTGNVDITCEQKTKLTIAAENDLLLPISPA